MHRERGTENSPEPAQNSRSKRNVPGPERQNNTMDIVVTDPVAGTMR